VNIVIEPWPYRRARANFEPAVVGQRERCASCEPLLSGPGEAGAVEVEADAAARRTGAPLGPVPTLTGTGPATSSIAAITSSVPTENVSS